MKKYMLNDLGNDWIFLGNNEEEAMQDFFQSIGVENLEKYLEYCEEVDQHPRLDFIDIELMKDSLETCERYEMPFRDMRH